MEASPAACMTPDQCFDEMAVALGLPKDTGYIDILAMVKKLNEDYNECFEERESLCSFTELNQEMEKLKEKNHRMERYIDFYEVKYCEICMAYKMDTEEYGHGGVWLNSKGCYMCDDCYDDLSDEEPQTNLSP